MPVIVHIDMNSFFASCEVKKDPSLKGKKIIIPGLLMKLANFAKRLVPTSVTVAGAYNIQKKKGM